MFTASFAVPQRIQDLAHGIAGDSESQNRKPVLSRGAIPGPAVLPAKYLHKRPVPVPKNELPKANAWRHRAPPRNLPENIQALASSAGVSRVALEKPVFTIIPRGMGKSVATEKVFDPLSITSKEPTIQGFTAPKIIIDLVHQSPEWKKLGFI